MDRTRQEGTGGRRERAPNDGRHTVERDEYAGLSPGMANPAEREDPLFDAPAESRRSWWQREPLTATELMNRDVVTAGPHTPARDLADLMRREQVGAIVVVDEEDRLLGVVTDRDLVVRGCERGRSVHTLNAGDLMTSHAHTVNADAGVHDILQVMSARRVRRVPVVDDQERLLGIVSLSDIAARADQDEELQQTLERIASRRSFWSRLWR
jgi:CBS domain-containing protein